MTPPRMPPRPVKTRKQLPHLPYPRTNRVIINAHNFPSSLWTPASITTQLWLDASDANTLYDATSGGSLVAADGGIARWEDKSGNARHVTQSTSGNRPLRKTAIKNSLDIARFDGTNDVLETSFSAFGTSYAMVAVAMATNATSAAGAILSCRSKTSSPPINPLMAYSSGVSQFTVRDDSSANNANTISGLANSTWYLFGGTRSGNNVIPYRDGTAGTTGTNAISTQTNSVTSVGGSFAGSSSASSFLNGDIAEIIVCDLADRVIVEGYLAHKYGMASVLPGGHTYKSSAP